MVYLGHHLLFSIGTEGNKKPVRISNGPAKIILVICQNTVLEHWYSA